MSRKALVITFLIALVAVVWGLIFFSPAPSSPNVVLIIIDTLRADRLGCYGFKEETSPELDNLAGSGVLFEEVIAQSSWTRPSIGSLLTSRYPRTLGIYKEDFDVLQQRFVTLAEVLKDNGYFTLGLTANPNINSYFQFDQGFDRYLDSNYVFPFMKPTAEQKVIDETPLPPASELFTQALALVEESRNSDSLQTTPLYLQIVVMDVHEHWKPEMVRPSLRHLFSEQGYPDYLRTVRQVSKDLDIFIKKLTSLPGMANTLFIITSDHGEGLGDHPNVKESHTHGYILYESQLFVPLIWYHPGVSLLSGKRIKQRVRLLDLMPSILDYLELPLPSRMEGVSLLGLLTGTSESVERPENFIVETNWRTTNKIALYTKDWKFFEHRDDWPGTDRYELQRMGEHEDGKNTNKITEHEGLAEDLRLRLTAWEKQHSKTESQSPGTSIDQSTVKQLKSLGYLQ